MPVSTLTHPSADNAASLKEKWVVFCVAFAAFSFQFEAFLVSIALPEMATELATSSTGISFVVLAYLLAATISFLPAGRLGDRFGYRRVFLYGALLASMGTLLSGLSINLHMLWISRFVQGLGMGALVAVSYAMIPTWINQKRLGWGYGMLSLGAGMGMVAGLPVGGLLAHYFSWQWIFLASLPIFAVLFVVAFQYLPRHRPVQAARPQHLKLDWIGLLLFALTVSGLMLTMSLGAELGWTSRMILIFILIAVVSASALFWRARRGQSLLSDALLRCPGFFLALLTLFLFQFVSSGIRFLMPFYLELNFGFSVLVSSALMLIFPLSFAPTGVWAGDLADRIGSRLVVLFALGGGTLICVLYGGFQAQINIWIFCLYLLCLGVICALFSPPNNRLLMKSVPQQNQGEASAFIPVAVNVGGLLGISFFETMFSLNFPRDASHSLQHLATMQQAQPTILAAFTNVFLSAGLIFFVSFVFVLLIKPSRKFDLAHR